MTRAQIEQELQRLEAAIPGLIAQYAPEDVLEAFAGEAEKLENETPAEDRGYVNARISCMLAAAGLIPGDLEDGQGCA